MKKKGIKKFTITESNHIIIKCKLNNVKSRFIVDTGASNSCVNYLSAEKFKISLKKSDEKASSATANINEIFYSINNTLQISHLKITNFDIILFDMNHINNSLKEKKIKKVDGIIGGDILTEYNAFINYEKKILTLNL